MSAIIERYKKLPSWLQIAIPIILLAIVYLVYRNGSSNTTASIQPVASGTSETDGGGGSGGGGSGGGGTPPAAPTINITVPPLVPVPSPSPVPASTTTVAAQTNAAYLQSFYSRYTAKYGNKEVGATTLESWYVNKYLPGAIAGRYDTGGETVLTAPNVSASPAQMAAAAAKARSIPSNPTVPVPAHITTKNGSSGTVTHITTAKKAAKTVKESPKK